MAHKKSILNKYLTDPEDTGDSEGNTSPIFQGNGWVIPETSPDNPTSKFLHIIYVFKKK